MGLIPNFSRDPDEVASVADEFEQLRIANSERLKRFETYRSEGNESRNPNLRAKLGSDAMDYGRQTKSRENQPRHDIPLPLGKALNVKHSYRISGQLPDVIVDPRDNSPEERYRSETMEKIVWSILRESRGETQFASGAWDGSELGASCFDLWLSIEKQMPIFRSIDPAGIIEVQGVDDPHDFQRMYHFWESPLWSVVAAYKEQTFRGEPVRVDSITSSHMTDGVEMCMVASLCDKRRKLVFLPDSKVGLRETVHDYGFVPYVIIPNIGPEREVWGWGDYEFVRPLVHYLSSLFSREADIIRAVANGAYLEKGTGQAPELVQNALATGGVIPSRRDGELSPVQPPDVPTFEGAHAERGMELFKMLGFAPDASWGSGISGSATDRGLMLQPLVEYTAMKQKNWEAGLGRLFSMAYKLMERKMVGEGVYRGAIPGHGSRRTPFVMKLGPNTPSEKVPNPAYQQGDLTTVEQADTLTLPRNPKELFDGDYAVRFAWNNRLDPDDPKYVLSETNKFTSGVQSLERTMERLGVESPEDEMKRMEAEAERFPWINQGMIQLLRAQMSQSNQGDGGGQPPNPQADQAQAAATASGQGGGALGLDAVIQGLGAGAQGVPNGGA